MWFITLFLSVTFANEPQVEASIATGDTSEALPARAGTEGMTLGMELLLAQQAELDALEVVSIDIDRGIDAPEESVLQLRDESWAALFGGHVMEVQRGLEGGRTTWSNTATAQTTVHGREPVEGLCVEAGPRAVGGELDLVVQPRGPRHADKSSDRALRRRRPNVAFWTGGERRKAGAQMASGESVTVVQVLAGDTHDQPDTRIDVQSGDWEMTLHEGTATSQICVNYGEEAIDAP